MSSFFEITTLSETDVEEFKELIKEYLPDSDIDVVRMRAKDYGEAYLTAKVDGKLAGIVFGWPRKIVDPNDNSFCINGVAVRESFQREGIGSRLLAELEKAVAKYGCKKISVGSAGGYVEQFYISNGFAPKEYKICTEQGVSVVKTFCNVADYEKYERPDVHGFVVLEKEDKDW